MDDVLCILYDALPCMTTTITLSMLYISAAHAFFMFFFSVAHVNSTLYISVAHSYSMRSDFDQSIESSVVAFFKTVTLNHTVNQFAFSTVLCNLLRVIASMPNSGTYTYIL